MIFNFTPQKNPTDHKFNFFTFTGNKKKKIPDLFRLTLSAKQTHIVSIWSCKFSDHSLHIPSYSGFILAVGWQATAFLHPLCNCLDIPRGPRTRAGASSSHYGITLKCSFYYPVPRGNVLWYSTSPPSQKIKIIKNSSQWFSNKLWLISPSRNSRSLWSFHHEQKKQECAGGSGEKPFNPRKGRGHNFCICQCAPEKKFYEQKVRKSKSDDTLGIFCGNSINAIFGCFARRKT